MVSRNSKPICYFDRKFLICDQIFKENLTITIEISVVYNLNFKIQII